MQDQLTPAEVDFLKALYDEEIRFTDAGLGRLFDEMKQQGLFEDTLIVLTSDHGEDFLAHGWLGHTVHLYEELLHVPLIIRPPGGLQTARAIPSPVSLIDLAPTILDLCHLEGATSGFQGKSIASVLFGESLPGPSVIFSEVDLKDSTAQVAKELPHRKSLIVQQLKIIRDDMTGFVEIYDLAMDPFELVNLAEKRKDLVDRLLPLLRRTFEHARSQALSPEEQSLSAEDLETLRSLGYVGQ